jgi:hypothetical protein
MPKTSEMRESKFLKQSDVGQGLLVTVHNCQQHNVAAEGAGHEMKWCLSFHEVDKPLVLNSTNIQLCEMMFGSDNTDDWVGQKLVLYVDPTVSYGGKITGGIRVRAPKVKGTIKPAPKPMPPPPPVADELTDDDIPF